MVWWVCRFDTLGKLVSAHRAGVNTTHGWCVTPTRCVRLAAAAPPPHTGWGWKIHPQPVGEVAAICKGQNHPWLVGHHILGVAASCNHFRLDGNWCLWLKIMSGEEADVCWYRVLSSHQYGKPWPQFQLWVLWRQTPYISDTHDIVAMRALMPER